MKTQRKLTAKQERFAREVASGKSGSDAYRAAYNAQNMTAKSVTEKASWLAKQVKVRARIRALATRADAKIEQKFDLTVERIAAEFEKLAFIDPGKLFDKKGKFLPVHKLPPEVRAAIASVEISTDSDGKEIQKIRLWDKRASLDSLAKWKGMFIERKVVITSPMANLAPDMQAQLKAALDELIESRGVPRTADGSPPRVTH